MLCRLLPIFLSVWAVSTKGAPAIQPSPKKILFPCQLYANTEVNIMLEIAEELRDRGHECTFLLIEAFQEKIESRGLSRPSRRGERGLCGDSPRVAGAG